MGPIEQAFLLVLDPYVIVVILAAAGFGLVVGALPGLTATMATALLVPLTFFMEPVPAIGAIVAASAMAIFAGDMLGHAAPDPRHARLGGLCRGRLQADRQGPGRTRRSASAS